MKVTYFFIVALCLFFACASTKKEGKPSPYASDSLTVADNTIKIAYSSPGVKEREIWGGLVPFDNIWRTGANEATIFECTKPMLVNQDTLVAGKYALFTIPTSHEWTIIFNKHWDQWGAYNYDQEQDALRVQIVPEHTKDFQERMKFDLDSNSLTFQWEYLYFEVPFEQL